MSSQSETSNYKYFGLPLTPPICEELILQLCNGQTLRTSVIEKLILSKHLASGGKKEANRFVDRALTNLKEKGLAQSPTFGHWRISGEPAVFQTPDATKVMELPIPTEAVVNVEVELGAGEGAVYLYYLPMYRRFAEEKGEKAWECKIGFTDRDAVGRVISQTTGLPEVPVLGVVLKTDNPRAWEGALHGVLKVRGRELPGLPGTEWFRTSVQEVCDIIKFIDPEIEKCQTPRRG